MSAILGKCSRYGIHSLENDLYLRGSCFFPVFFLMWTVFLKAFIEFVTVLLLFYSLFLFLFFFFLVLRHVGSSFPEHRLKPDPCHLGIL